MNFLIAYIIVFALSIPGHAKNMKETDFIDTKGNIIGKVAVSLYDSGGLFEVSLTDIEPGWHGMHLHENADCSDPDQGFKKSGSHFNPENKQHGLKNEQGFHHGDLANIYAFNVCENKKNATQTKTRAKAQQIIPWLNESSNLGKVAIIVHEKRDDYQTDSTGNAGSRIACAVIDLK